MHENYLTLYRPVQYTHNINLKNRLTSFTEQYPECCTMTDEDGKTGRTKFKFEKGRLTFRLTAPCIQERRQQASLKGGKSGFDSKAMKAGDVVHIEQE